MYVAGSVKRAGSQWQKKPPPKKPLKEHCVSRPNQGHIGVCCIPRRYQGGATALPRSPTWDFLAARGPPITKPRKGTAADKRVFTYYKLPVCLAAYKRSVFTSSSLGSLAITDEYAHGPKRNKVGRKHGRRVDVCLRTRATIPELYPTLLINMLAASRYTYCLPLAPYLHAVWLE